MLTRIIGFQRFLTQKSLTVNTSLKNQVHLSRTVRVLAQGYTQKPINGLEAEDEEVDIPSSGKRGRIFETRRLCFCIRSVLVSAVSPGYLGGCLLSTISRF